MKDIQFNDGTSCFNCRVNGVCIKENKILLSKLRTDKYWTFVGGKVQFNESTDSAVLREFKEEVGVELQIEKLLALIENFFDMQGKLWHQYIFFYQLKDDDDMLKYFEGEQEVLDNKNAIYRWFDLDELADLPIRPECSIEILKNRSSGIQHYIEHDS